MTGKLLLFKSQLKNREGLVLRPVRDKLGRVVGHWVKAHEDAPREHFFWGHGDEKGEAVRKKVSDAMGEGKGAEDAIQGKSQTPPPESPDSYDPFPPEKLAEVREFVRHGVSRVAMERANMKFYGGGAKRSVVDDIHYDLKNPGDSGLLGEMGIKITPRATVYFPDLIEAAHAGYRDALESDEFNIPEITKEEEADIRGLARAALDRMREEWNTGSKATDDYLFADQLRALIDKKSTSIVDDDIPNGEGEEHDDRPLSEKIYFHRDQYVKAVLSEYKSYLKERGMDKEIDPVTLLSGDEREDIKKAMLADIEERRKGFSDAIKDEGLYDVTGNEELGDKVAVAVADGDFDRAASLMNKAKNDYALRSVRDAAEDGSVDNFYDIEFPERFGDYDIDTADILIAIAKDVFSDLKKNERKSDGDRLEKGNASKPLLLLFKSFVKQHERTDPRTGKKVKVAAHYDKRVKRGEQSATTATEQYANEIHKLLGPGAHKADAMKRSKTFMDAIKDKDVDAIHLKIKGNSHARDWFERVTGHKISGKLRDSLNAWAGIPVGARKEEEKGIENSLDQRSLSEKLAAFAAATNNELFDPEYKGGEWMGGAVETHETLDHWEESSKRWNERSTMKSGQIAGFPFLSWSRVQQVNGQPRRSISVVDFGEVRFVIDSDLSMFSQVKIPGSEVKEVPVPEKPLSMSQGKTEPEDKRYLTMEKIKRRGWTDGMVAKFLGKHDSDAPSRYQGRYRNALPARLWEKDRVLRAEQAPEFVAAMQKRLAAEKKKSEAKERLASGALLYDADGWLSSKDQEERHAGFMQEASLLREKARKLLEKGAKMKPLLLLIKGYVKPHKRTLKSGKVIEVGGYNTKRGPAKGAAGHPAPVKGAAGHPAPGHAHDEVIEHKREKSGKRQEGNTLTELEKFANTQRLTVHKPPRQGKTKDGMIQNAPKKQAAKVSAPPPAKVDNGLSSIWAEGKLGVKPTAASVQGSGFIIGTVNGEERYGTRHWFDSGSLPHIKGADAASRRSLYQPSDAGKDLARHMLRSPGDGVPVAVVGGIGTSVGDKKKKEKDISYVDLKSHDGDETRVNATYLRYFTSKYGKDIEMRVGFPKGSPRVNHGKEGFNSQPIHIIKDGKQVGVIMPMRIG